VETKPRYYNIFCDNCRTLIERVDVGTLPDAGNGIPYVCHHCGYTGIAFNYTISDEPSTARQSRRVAIDEFEPVLADLRRLVNKYCDTLPSHAEQRERIYKYRYDDLLYGYEFERERANTRTSELEEARRDLAKISAELLQKKDEMRVCRDNLERTEILSRNLYKEALLLREYLAFARAVAGQACSKVNQKSSKRRLIPKSRKKHGI
jgi:hypothetical protein